MLKKNRSCFGVWGETNISFLNLITDPLVYPTGPKLMSCSTSTLLTSKSSQKSSFLGWAQGSID